MARFNSHDSKQSNSEEVVSLLKDAGLGFGAAVATVLGSAISGVSTTVLTSMIAQGLQEQSPELGLALDLSAIPAGIVVGSAAFAAGVDLTSRNSRIRKAFEDHRKVYEDIRFHGKVDRRGFHAVALPVRLAASVAEALNKLTNGKDFSRMLSRTLDIQARQEPGTDTWFVRHTTARGVGNWVEHSEEEFKKIEEKILKSKTPFIKEGLNLETGQWVSETLIGGVPDSRVTHGPSRRSRQSTYAGGPETSYESAVETWHLNGRSVTPPEVALSASGLSDEQLATRLERTAQETKVDQCSLRDDLKAKIAGATHVRFSEDHEGLMEVRFEEGPFIRAGFISYEDIQTIREVLPRETTVGVTYQGMIIAPDPEVAAKPMP